MKLILPSILLTFALGFANAEEKPGRPGKGEKGKHHAPEAIVKHLDKDADGSLSMEEFKASKRAQENPEKAGEAFKKIDADSNGKLTVEELKAAPHPGKGKGKGKKKNA